MLNAALISPHAANSASLVITMLVKQAGVGPGYSADPTLLGQHEIVFLQTTSRCTQGLAEPRDSSRWAAWMQPVDLSEKMQDLSCMDTTEAVPVHLRVRKSPGPTKTRRFPWIALFSKPSLLSLARYSDLSVPRAQVSKVPVERILTLCRSYGDKWHHPSRNAKIIFQMVQIPLCECCALIDIRHFASFSAICKFHLQ